MEKKSTNLMAKITIVFIVGILFLVFISRTIYEYNLPAVTVAFASSGIIVNSTTAETVVALEGEKDIISENEGVIELFVEKGTALAQDDLLYTITRDLSSIEDELEGLYRDREMLQVTMSKTESDIEYYQANPPDSDYPDMDLRDYDYDMEQVQASLKREQEELDRLNILLAQGAIAESAVREQQDIIEELERRQEKIAADRQKAMEDHNRLVEDTDKQTSDNTRAWEKSISDLYFQRREDTLRLSHINSQISDLQRQLANEGTLSVYAPVDGIVTGVYDNVRSGRYISKNIPVLSIQPEDLNCKAVFSLSNDIDYITEGDTATLRVRSKNLSGIEGLVEKLYYSEDKLMAEVTFTAEGLHGGERVEARFRSESSRYDYVLPNTAIREGEYYHVLYVERIKTSYGYDYIARPKYISIEEEGRTESAVFLGSYENEAIIINSNMPIMDNSKVKIVGGSDLLEHESR